MITKTSNTSAPIRTGSRSIKIAIPITASEDSSGRLNACCYYQTTLTAGTTYTFSGYFRNTNDSNFNDDSKVYLSVHKVSGTTALVAVGSILTQATNSNIEDGWIRLSVTYTPDTTGTYNLACWVSHIYGTSALDDFQLEEGETPSEYNLLGNGDAEWTDDWSFSTGASTGSALIHGSKSIQIIGNPRTERYASIQIPLNLSSDNTSVLSGWAQADTVADLGDEDRSLGERKFALEVVLTYSNGNTETHTASFAENSGLLLFL